MKKSILLGACLCSSLFISAQTTNSSTNGSENGQGVIHWKLDGNQATENHFMGTTNEKPLIFKSNGVEGMRLSPSGDITFDRLKLDVNNEISLPRIAMISKEGMISTLTVNEIKGLVYNVIEFDKSQFDCINPFGDFGKYNVGWKSVKGTEDTPAQLFANSSCGDVNVGINVADPKEALDVDGNIFVDRGMLSVNPRFGANKWAGAWRTVLHTPINSTWLSSDTTENGYYTGLTLGEHGLHYSRSKEGIGEGGGNTKHIFYVKTDGGVIARELTVTLWDWPDYVFNSSYDLKSLEEVETYIKKNKHLPNVPSQQVIEDEGLNVGEMQKIQMEKIEELTLYMIEMKKEIEALKHDNQVLKTSIQAK